MKPTFVNHGQDLVWAEPGTLGEQAMSPVVAQFTHAGEEFVVVLWQPHTFAVVSMASGKKVS